MSSLFSVRRSYALIGMVACLGWLFFFFRSEYFDLKGVEVQASGGIISSEDVLPIVFRTLDEQSSRPWSKRQRFFLPEHAIEEGVKMALYAEQVEAGETHDNILRLKISFGSRFLYTSQNGEVFLRCAVARPSGVPLTDASVIAMAKQRFLSTDFTTQGFDGYVYVRTTTSSMEAATIKQLLELGKQFDRYRIPFAHLEERTGHQVAVQLNREKEVLLDLDQPLQQQVDQLQSLTHEKAYQVLKPGVIDLTIPGRAYLR